MDVYIDDLGRLEMVPLASLKETFGPDFEAVARVDQFYVDTGIPQSVHKAVRGECECARLWGAEARGKLGTVASPLQRRIGSACLSWLWVA